MKPSSFRRRAAGIAMIGAGALALLSGPALAHQQNGNPDLTNPADPVNGRHDVISSPVVNVIRMKPDGCSSNTAPYGSPCPVARSRSNQNDGTTNGTNIITNASNFFVAADVGRTITAPDIPPSTVITTYTSATQVTISNVAGNTAGTDAFTVVLDPVIVRAPTFNGTPGGTQNVAILLCNGAIITDAASGGGGDLLHGCDYSNARGLAPLTSGFPASSGTLVLDATGNLTTPATVQLFPPACTGASGSMITDLLTPMGGPNCTNAAQPAATCPPSSAEIAAGWTCRTLVAEYNPTLTFALGTHVGYRTTNLKSPIPTKLCDPPGPPVSFGACGATIPAGTSVKLNGVRFPCKIIRPDDPAVGGNQGSCLTAWTNKTILMKRQLTGLLEGGAITPTSQTAGLNGDYTTTFTMPTLLFPGEIYKMVPHSPDCPGTQYGQGNSGYGGTSNWIVDACESGKFNAAGVTFKQ